MLIQKGQPPESNRPVWILGLKTEGARTVLETTGGGQTELLGGLLYPVEQVSPDIPAFINTSAQSSLTYATSANAANRNYTIQVQETRGGVTKTLSRTDVPTRGDASNPGTIMPLYVNKNGS